MHGPLPIHPQANVLEQSCHLERAKERYPAFGVLLWVVLVFFFLWRVVKAFGALFLG